MKPSTLKCLKLLRENESVTTHDFLIGGCGSRFGARLAELRHEHGCVITEHKLSDRSGSRYRLVAEPETSEMPRSSGESRATTVSAGADPCEAMATPAARDSSTSAHRCHAGIAGASQGLITPRVPGSTPGPAIDGSVGQAPKGAPSEDARVSVARLKSDCSNAAVVTGEQLTFEVAA